MQRAQSPGPFGRGHFAVDLLGLNLLDTLTISQGGEICLSCSTPIINPYANHSELAAQLSSGGGPLTMGGCHVLIYLGLQSRMVVTSFVFIGAPPRNYELGLETPIYSPRLGR